MSPAHIVVLVLTTATVVLLVLIEMHSRRNVAAEKQRGHLNPNGPSADGTGSA